MTDARMLIIVPTRSRPENVAKVVRAWEDTDAFRHASLEFVIDNDDPKFVAYQRAIEIAAFDQPGISATVLPEWMPLVPKIHAALKVFPAVRKHYFAIGFAGDDHLPRTPGWAARYLEKLMELGTGVVSCPDGYRRDDLPTQWAMTADIVRTLGRMVPAPVEHLYCDNAVWDLAKAAGCYAYLDDVLIEHMHPVAGKADSDEQYRKVNSVGQYSKDRWSYSHWKLSELSPGLKRDAEQVRKLLTSE
jgi:hypothetical protein